jgi:hypothetical protein
MAERTKKSRLAMFFQILIIFALAVFLFKSFGPGVIAYFELEYVPRYIQPVALLNPADCEITESALKICAEKTDTMSKEQVRAEAEQLLSEIKKIKPRRGNIESLLLRTFEYAILLVVENEKYGYPDDPIKKAVISAEIYKTLGIFWKDLLDATSESARINIEQAAIYASESLWCLAQAKRSLELGIEEKNSKVKKSNI